MTTLGHKGNEAAPLMSSPEDQFPPEEENSHEMREVNFNEERWRKQEEEEEKEEEEMHGHGHGGHGHAHGIMGLFSGGGKGSFTVIKQILTLAKDDWVILVGGLASLILSTLINITMPYSLTFILERALLPGTSWSRVVLLACSVLGVFVIGAILTGIRVFCFQVGGERVTKRLRLRLFSLVVTQPTAFFDFMEPGEIVSRLTADCELLRVTLTATLVLALRFGIQVIGGIALLLYISWQLTLVLTAILPVLALVAVCYSRKARFLGQTLQNSIAASSSLATEVLSAIRHVRAFDQERYESERYRQRLGATYDLARRLGIANAFFLGGTELGSYIAVIGVLLYATYLVVEGSLTIESITSFVLYSVYVAHAVGALSNQAAELSRAVGASERVFRLLDTINASAGAPQVVSEQHSKPRGDIKFSQVNFVYPAHGRTSGHASEKSPPRISDVSFHIFPGEILGVIGPSGAGKSTLLSLVLRFYDPESGSIELDGKNVTELSPSWVRRNVGFVSQEPTLFNTTIFENIRYGLSSATVGQVEGAAKSARIHEYIHSLPLGYQTVVGDRGSRLSGGQKQRIALARVFLKDAPIVLFDEPTSSLDSENEQLVMETIKSLFQGRTCIIISHSPELLREVSKILVMGPGGKMEAVGTPEELRTSCSTYIRLFERS